MPVPARWSLPYLWALGCLTVGLRLLGLVHFGFAVFVCGYVVGRTAAPGDKSRQGCDMTHYADYPDPRMATQLALCYVRTPSENISPAPTCPWCLRKLQERS